MKIAINQPYFSPYSGYFSLIAAADIFVIYDCVQFIRRGRIHRSQIHATSKFNSGWLTLPIVKMPRETSILNMQLYPLFQGNYSKMELKLFEFLADDFDLNFYRQHTHALVDFLQLHLTSALKRLRINTKIVRSSDMAINLEEHGQNRILSICKHLKATEYINLPGGKDLYDPTAFRANDISLNFLDTFSCSRLGYLQAFAEGEESRFLNEAHQDLRAR